MYTIWDEVNRFSVIMLILGAFFSVASLYMDAKYDWGFLVITIIYFIYVMKQVFKYLSLKKNGTIVEDLPYEFKHLNNREKVIIVKYVLNGDVLTLRKHKLKWGRVEDTGTTNILIDMNKPKHYFVFDPKKQKKN